MNPEEFIDQIIDVDLCREAFKLYDKEDSGTIQKTVRKRIQIENGGKTAFDISRKLEFWLFAEKSFIQKEERKVHSVK